MWLTGFAHGTWNIVLGVIIGTGISGQVIENSLFSTITSPLKTTLSGGDFGLEGGVMMTIVSIAMITVLIAKAKAIK